MKQGHYACDGITFDSFCDAVNISQYPKSMYLIYYIGFVQVSVPAANSIEKNCEGTQNGD